MWHDLAKDIELENSDYQILGRIRGGMGRGQSMDTKLFYLNRSKNCGVPLLSIGV
jgi:hypothetical protein